LNAQRLSKGVLLTIWHAIILGIVQGLSEFLPISSSGHLILVRDLFGWNFGNPDIEKTFDVALHLGTFFGIAAYFWADIGRLLRGFFKAIAKRSLNADPYSKLAILVLISTVPAALAGIKGEAIIEEKLGAPVIICALLVIFGLVLAAADIFGRKFRDISTLGIKEAILIGIAQALALAPGISRSGVTMSAGLGLGLDRQSAARYSFLISLPAIAGAALYKGAKLAGNGIPPELGIGPMVAGILAATISGFIAIAWLLKFLQTRSLKPFVIYRVVVGIGLGIFFLLK
jgi:undecaprenyl-diphosphatase